MFILISFLSTNSLEAQLLKKLKKRVQEATEDVIAEKAAQKAEQEVGKTLDSLLDIDPDYQANYQRQMSQFMLSGSEDIPIEESYTFQTRVTYEFTMTERDQTSTVNYEMWFPKNDGYMGTKVMDQPDSDPKDMPSSVVSIIDDKNQAMIILMEEQKIAQLLSMSKIQEIAEVEKETESEMTAFNSLQKTGNTKKILGYDCEEFYSQNETNKLTFWVTQDLELFQKNMFFNISKSLGGNTFENIPETAKGFMMEMRFENLSTVETGIMTVTDIKKSEKVITMADYQLMNLSRFMQK
ncbi:MAG: DUF4412 domain-containing protein [Flavobacteriales bacterium]|nr:DUF4412 domain-containing protein [Flavobacteriales bacterium]